jgi:hypothetical protein
LQLPDGAAGEGRTKKERDGEPRENNRWWERGGRPARAVALARNGAGSESLELNGAGRRKRLVRLRLTVRFGVTSEDAKSPDRLRARLGGKLTRLRGARLREAPFLRRGCAPRAARCPSLYQEKWKKHPTRATTARAWRIWKGPVYFFDSRSNRWNFVSARKKAAFGSAERCSFSARCLRFSGPLSWSRRGLRLCRLLALSGTFPSGGG